LPATGRAVAVVMSVTPIAFRTSAVSTSPRRRSGFQRSGSHRVVHDGSSTNKVASSSMV
jgi:hypothetical protein